MSSYRAKRIIAKARRRKRSHLRLRKRIVGTTERPRLAVHKSLKFVYAQVIDDQSGRTLAQANSAENDLGAAFEGSAGSVAAAKAVGEAIAERAKAEGVEAVVFDRGGYIYHGKVKALAEAARGKGLVF